MSNELRVIISGGGTGGHIFPAVSIANAIKALRPDAKILFVGAQGRMEMQRVPAAGYDIEGLPIRGFLRPLWKLGNIGVAIDYLRSKHMAKKLLRQVGLFDVYRGDKIPAGKKQYALSFVIQDLEKTLTDQDTERVMERLLSTFQTEFGAQLR